MITIVSGLPRSGTSMMMQMLEAGGLPALVDGIRKADEDNPKGYFEFEAAKQVKTDFKWLDDAMGKVVKMVYTLLYNLPVNRNYKIIFMERNIKEVLASQDKMLVRTGKKTDVGGHALMAKLFEAQIDKVKKWLSGQDNPDTLYVNYNDVVLHPEKNASKINSFLGGNLNHEKMAQIVDKTLYRQRI